MTNYEKWLLFTKNIASPQKYIDFGFYWLISAALQRRVWYSNYDHNPLFPNLYIIFVGRPAVGKGFILGPINTLLRMHKNEKMGMIKTSTGNEYPSLFPVGGDAMSYEELLADIADSARVIPVRGNSGYTKSNIYAHTSYSFVLEEISSLFRRKVEDIGKFLLNAYDAKEHGYEYLTKHSGKDRIRRLCLSFIGGTQPDELANLERMGVFKDGLSSRMLFIFEAMPRFFKFHQADMDEEQLKAKADIAAYIKRLATLFGQLTYSQEVTDWLEDWYVNDNVKKEQTANAKMQHYYGRKRVSLLKMAAAVHFADNLDYIITLDDVKKALELLNSLETSMEAGFNSNGRNELAGVSKKILNYIKSLPAVSKREIIIKFIVDLSLEEIDLCLRELELTSNLKNRIEKGQVVYYL